MTQAVQTQTKQLQDLLKEFNLKFKPTDNISELKVKNEKTKPNITVSTA